MLALGIYENQTSTSPVATSGPPRGSHCSRGARAKTAAASAGRPSPGAPTPPYTPLFGPPTRPPPTPLQGTLQDSRSKRGGRRPDPNPSGPRARPPPLQPQPRCAASASPDRALALNLPSRPQWWWQVRSHFCPHFWPMTRACLLLPRSVLCQMGRRTWEWTPGAPRHWHLARGGPGRELSELGGDTPASWLGEAGEGPGRLEEVAPAFIIEG